MHRLTQKRRDFIRSMMFGSFGLSQLSYRNLRNFRTSSKKRIMVAHFFDETNTFIEERRTLDDIKETAKYGNSFLRSGGMVHGTVGTALDGFVDCAELYDVELIGSISVEGNHRMMTGEVFDYVTGYILQTLDQFEVDGIYLSFHGAGCTEGHDDLEGETMRLIRQKVGREIPMVFSMDLHCTLTRLMAEMADGVSIYRTYPHIDAFETGYEAATMLMGMLFGNINPVIAIQKIPLMIGPPLQVMTAEDPMKQVYQRAKWMQRTIPGVLACCPAHGFMQQDVPEQGAGVAVTTDGDEVLAQKLAAELADLMFSFRRDYWIELPGVAETIRLANKATRPVAIADSGDNIGAGGAGDGTHLLEEVLRTGSEGVFVQIYDPESTQRAYDAGIGKTISLEVGAKSHPMYGSPVAIRGQVTVLSKEGEPWHPSVRIEMKGVTLLLNSKRIGPNDQTNVRAMKIFPENYKISICKGGFAFRPQYPPDVFDYILSATPGYSSPDLSTFTWKRIPRPIFPLDKI